MNIFMMVLAIISTVYDSFYYRWVRYLIPGFLGRKLSCIYFMLFLHIFARSAGQVPLPENVLHSKQWHQRQQENYQPADLPAKNKTKRAENHR